jgi:hypothetical protein
MRMLLLRTTLLRRIAVVTTHAPSEGHRGIATLLGRLAVLMLISLAGCVSGTTSDQQAREIIARAKAATGGKAWDRIAIWHEVGEVTSATGEKSRYEHWQDFGSLALRNIGGGMDHMVFDGHDAYGCPNPACDPRRALDATSIRDGAYQTAFGFSFLIAFPLLFSTRAPASTMGFTTRS